MANLKIIIPVSVAVGIFLGLVIYEKFLLPEIEESTVVTEKETIDTTFNDVAGTIQFDSLRYQSLSDSIDYYRSLYEEELGNIKIVKENEPFSAPLRTYSGFEPTLYGNIGYNAVVAGKMLDMTITNDLRLPTITNTVTTEKVVTQTRDLRGLYAGASASLDLDYKLGASYVDRDWQFNYDYQPKVKMHWVGVKRRVF